MFAMNEERYGGRRGRGMGRGGPGLPGGGRHGGPRGARFDRMRRGDIRTALLAVLAEAPGHGYDLIGRLEEKSGGAWRPSPGSVYPTLQMLEDEGLIRSEERDGKRVYEITDAGRTEGEQRVADDGAPPWELLVPGGRPSSDMREAIAQLALATKQIAGAGNEAQRERAVEILVDARKRLYGILAEE